MNPIEMIELALRRVLDNARNPYDACDLLKALADELAKMYPRDHGGSITKAPVSYDEILAGDYREPADDVGPRPGYMLKWVP